MDRILPSEILIEIFSYLTVEDIPSVCDTCTYWKYIVESFDLWKIHWKQLLQCADKSGLKHDTCLVLKQVNINDIDLKCSCIRLKNMIFNNYNYLYYCLKSDRVRTFNHAVLKTHFSHMSLSIFKYSYSTSLYHLKKTNTMSPDSKLYNEFRSPQEIQQNIDKFFDNKKSKSDHIHIKNLMYFYPMGVSEEIRKYYLRHFFETCHVEEVILMPRVVTLCNNLDVSDAIVVYSTSRSTEVAVIVNGVVGENRWCELPIGGWNVAKNLHTAFQWEHPSDETDIRKFDNIDVKSLCWVKMYPPNNMKNDIVSNLNASLDDSHEKSFIMKHEQFLAAEVMYIELELNKVIPNLLNGLPENMIRNCLRHVFLTGGNCQLKHLSIRLKLDLMKMMPEYANIISTSVHNGKILSYLPPEDISEMERTQIFEIGKKCRLKREHYIIGDFDS